MAKQHTEPMAPVGTGTERLDKHASTAFEQDRLGPSPAKPYRRPPASASYDPSTGLPCRVGQDCPDSFRQIPSAGDHTEAPPPRRSSRPGRW
jgi:hypothetical protein